MPEKFKILIAEDDTNLGTVFSEYLSLKGYEVKLCEDGEQGLLSFKRHHFDLCILDIMMPRMDGFSLATEIRKINKKVPFIFLTAKSLNEDKIKGFELGADDYITKPFVMEELILRIKAILRRTQNGNTQASSDRFKIGKFDFNASEQLLTMGSQQHNLTTKESALLKLLCLNINDVLKREVALKMIWANDDYFNARSMDVFITKLRKYLSEDPSLEIKNIHGEGFKLLVKS